MIMKVTAYMRAATTTARGMIASTAVSFGQKPSEKKIAAVTSATLRLATPVAEARPALGVEVLTPPGVPAIPAKMVASPSLRTPRVIDRMSGLTQVESLVFSQMVIVPAAFIAAARLAIANGATSAALNDQSM